MQPATCELADRSCAAQTSLQDVSPLRQTRMDWLPGVQAEGVGFNDWVGCDVVWAYAVPLRKRTPSKIKPNRVM